MKSGHQILIVEVLELSNTLSCQVSNPRLVAPGDDVIIVYSSDLRPTFVIDEDQGTLRNIENIDFERLGSLVELTLEARDGFHITLCKVILITSSLR